MSVNNADEAIEIARKTLVTAGHNIYWITETRRTDSECKVSARTLATDRLRIIIDASNGTVKELVPEQQTF